LVMEYVEGTSLKQVLQIKGALPLDQALYLFKQILKGIGHAHSKGVIHRDVKPANILINREQTVKITDFGIAKFSGNFIKTTTGVQLGTLAYMSPERIKSEPLGRPADIYSLGVTLYEMLIGQNPFGYDSEYKIIKSILEGAIPLPQQVRPSIPAPIHQAILQAMANKPGDRFQSVEDFSQALSGADLYPSAISTEERKLPADENSNPLPVSEKGPVLSLFKSNRFLFLSATALLLLVGLGYLALELFIFKKTDYPPTPPPAIGPLNEFNPQLAIKDLTSVPKDNSRTMIGEAEILKPSSPASSQAINKKEPEVQKRSQSKRIEAPQQNVQKLQSRTTTTPREEQPPMAFSPSTGVGYLSVVSYPGGLILLNNRELGFTPLEKIALPVGRNELTLKVSGVEKKWSLTVRKNEHKLILIKEGQLSEEIQ